MDVRYFVRFGYAGYRFTGFQRGNGDHSIEDSIISTLRKNSIESDIQCAARTDRGVSALGNVFAIDTEASPSRIMGILNSGCRDIFFTAYTAVSEAANPRHCLRKTYSYYMRDIADMALLSEQVHAFMGTHNFREFCRADARNPVRTIDRIWVEKVSEREVSINFTARSFIWMQIRNIIGFTLESLARGHLRDPFSGEGWGRKPASPLSLILWNIEYDGVDFIERHSRSLERHYRNEASVNWANSRVSDEIAAFL